MDTIALWAPTVVSLAIGIYIYGRLAERVKGLNDTLQETARRLHDAVEDTEKRLDLHEAKIESHSVQLAKLAAWHEGYLAGSLALKADKEKDLR